MRTLNGWVIQEALKQEKRINVPWVQVTFSVPYLQAKEMLAEMEGRGWVQRSPGRVDWRVIHRNLFLRHLDPSETEVLCANLTADCLAALDRLQKADGMRVSYADLAEVVRGEADTREAIRVLSKLKLIFYARNTHYYSCIPAHENRALTVALRRHLRRESAGGLRDDEETLAVFRRMLWRAIQASTAAADDADDMA